MARRKRVFEKRAVIERADSVDRRWIDVGADGPDGQGLDKRSTRVASQILHDSFA